MAIKLHFEKELAELKEKLLTMASHAETAVNHAIEALVKRDLRPRAASSRRRIPSSTSSRSRSMRWRSSC